MSSDKFTPGPWKIFCGHTKLSWFIVYKIRPSRQRTEAAKVFKFPRLVVTEGIEEEAIASVDSVGINHNANKDSNLIEAEANARLIAAAPELLEALKEITSELDVNYQNDANGEDSLTEKERIRIIDKCKLIIAKAEGADE